MLCMIKPRDTRILVALCMIISLAPHLQAFNDMFIDKSKEFIVSGTGGGELNALGNYIKAMELFDPEVFYQVDKKIYAILETGWKPEHQREMQYMKLIQPMLSEIWKGNEKTFVMYPSYNTTLASPDYDSLTMMGKIMTCQAMFCAYIHKPDYALQWFKHSLIFGQRICDPDAAFESKTASLDVEKAAINAYTQFLLTTPMTTDQYKQIATDLQEIYNRETPIWQMLRSAMAFYEIFGKALDTAITESKGEMNWQTRSFAKEMQKEMEKEKKQRDAFLQEIEDLLKQGYPTFIKADLKSKSFAIKEFAPRCRATAINEALTKAHFGMLIAAAQILAYRATNNTLPPNSEALKSMGFFFPEDPFSQSSLRYVLEGNTAIIYSIGADLKDDQGKLVWNWERGPESSGDHVLVIK